MMGTPVCCRISGLVVVAVLPQPVVKQRVPGRMLRVDGARHTGEIRGVSVTGDDSFSRAMSLLKVALL